MSEKKSTSVLLFGDVARGLGASVQLSFCCSKPLEGCIGEQLIIVGQSVSGFVQSLTDTPIRSAILDILPAEAVQAKGWSGTLHTPVGGKKTKTQVIITPTEASRHNNPYRADSMTKSLMGVLGETIGDAGKTDAKRVDVVCALPSVEAVRSTCFGIARALPRFTRKTERGKDLDASKGEVKVCVRFFLSSGEAVDAAKLDAIAIVAESVRMSQSLTDAPPNELNTTTYLDFVEKVVQSLGAKVEMKTIRGKQLEEQGFGGIWGVGRGNTVNPPALVILTYRGSAGEKKDSVVLVGKGIVYDSGGLSIKAGAFMCGMKTDMSGSAAMFSSFVALVRLGGLPTGEDLHCVLCLAENSIGPDAYRNDDILRLYSGLTVEINNTDAEGRLVLADGCAYAVKHLSPRLVMDMATLTGAQGICTGINHGAVLSAYEEEETGLVAAGKISGDLAFPIIFCPEFHRLNYKSEVADMKNSVTNRADAGSSASGWFIYDHMNAAGYTGRWAHIDMAAPATFHPSGRGTGYGVGLICSFLHKL